MGKGRRGGYGAIPLILPIKLYRLLISPILPRCCRFHPSCSAYAIEALETHGAVKGLLLALWRVLRCHPLSAGGLDLVPKPGKWRPDMDAEGHQNCNGN